MPKKTIDMQELLVYEKQFLAQGKKIIAGVDEVGRGPLAGPVVVACLSMKIKSFRALQTAKSFPQNTGKNCTTV